MAQATERQARHGYNEHDSYIGSPMARVIDTGAAFRRRLTQLDEEHDHQLLFDLRSEGATDYLVYPVANIDPFSEPGSGDPQGLPRREWRTRT